MTKNVDFLHLTVEGFRSYQKATAFPFAGKGVVLIKGPTGAGKTTIFSALTWALYKLNLNGTTNDKVQTWENKRLPEWRGTRVTITFRTGGYYYMVARHLGFKGKTKGLKVKDTLMIFRKGGDCEFTQDDLVGEAQHKCNQQEYINRVIGVEPHTFINSILFGQRMPRLVSSKNDDKRELFETLFDLDFIDPAKKKAQAKKQEQEIKIAEERQVIQAHTNALQQLKDRLSEQMQIKAEFTAKKNNRVKSLEAKLAELETALNNLRTGLETRKEKVKISPDAKELDKLEQKYEEAKQSVEAAELIHIKRRKERNDWAAKVDQYDTFFKDAEKKKAKLKKDLECVAEDCPSCKQPLKKSEVATVKSNIKDQIKGIEELETTYREEEKIATKKFTEVGDRFTQTDAELIELNGWSNALRTKVQEKRKAFADLDAIKKQISEREALIPHYEKNVEEVKAEILEVKAEKPPKIDTKDTEESISRMVQALEQRNGILLGLQQELDYTNWWITKAFGSGGLKAFVFSAMLGRLNTYIDRYASRMGFKVRFTVDLSKASKPFVTKVFKDDFEIDYSDLSGGQKQRLDCMVMFAMNDLVSTIVNINFLILDEIFEGLDPANVEAIFDLIRVKAEAGKHVFVVTHSQIIDSLSTKSLYVELDEAAHVSTIS